MKIVSEEKAWEILTRSLMSWPEQGRHDFAGSAGKVLIRSKDSQTAVRDIGRRDIRWSVTCTKDGMLLGMPVFSALSCLRFNPCWAVQDKADKTGLHYMDVSVSDAYQLLHLTYGVADRAESMWPSWALRPEDVDLRINSLWAICKWAGRGA